jgi:quinol monooxygenase YgiN
MNNAPVTLINVFSVDPAKQEELVKLLVRAAESSVRRARGFVSARVHRSLDGTKVAMYEEWQSSEAYQDSEDLAPLPDLEQALTIAKSQPALYELVQTFLPPKS